MANAQSAEFKTPMCRLSYAAGLYRASQVNGQGATKFTCTLIFDNADKKIFLPYMQEVIVAQWGDKGLARAKTGLIRSPLLAGDGKEARNKSSGEISAGLDADKFFLRVQSGADRPPAVIWKNPNEQETEATVYSGCYGKAVLRAFAWSNPTGGDGVSFSIALFQKLKEGERLGGGAVDPTKYFETVEDLGDAPASTQGGAGAGGLFGE